MTHDHVTSAQVKLRRRRAVHLFITVLLVANFFQLLCLAYAPWWGAYAEVPISDKILLQSVWNHDGSLGLQGGISFRKDRVDALWGWDWQRPTDALPKSSMTALYGHSPWLRKSTTGALPVRISCLRTMDVHYEFETKGSGKYVTGIKIYLTDGSVPKPENLRVEIMIWLHTENTTPWAEPGGTLRIGNDIFGRWIGRIESWKAIILQPRAEKSGTTLDIAQILKALAARNDIDEKLYVAAIELGDEITMGSGYTALRKFDVTVRSLPEGAR